MERDKIVIYELLQLEHFNSHAHVERDFTKTENFTYTIISTHTLTWSVTGNGKCCEYRLYISTHTLTWSVTGLVLDKRQANLNFNSHAHVERDPRLLPRG